MLNTIADKLRAFAHRKLEGEGDVEQEHPLKHRIREVANTVNDLLGKPIRAADDPVASSGSPVVAPAAAATPVQAPVLLYFDGKDHRTKTKVEELLSGRDIVFRLIDVADDEAERSWIVTAAKQTEFPIVVIAGTPVGGLAELVQLDVEGKLKNLVFGAA